MISHDLIWLTSIWLFPKIMVPPKSSHFNRVFHYKPSILGYPYFWKHPFSISLLLHLVQKEPFQKETFPPPHRGTVGKRRLYRGAVVGPDSWRAVPFRNSSTITLTEKRGPASLGWLERGGNPVGKSHQNVETKCID